MIGGASRSGTTFLKKTLDSNSSYCFTDSEVTFFKNSYIQTQKSFLATNVEAIRALDSFMEARPEFAFLKPVVTQRLKPPIELGEILRITMESYANHYGRSHWGIKCPFLERYADRVFQFFPETRMLYCVRDPFDVCLSRKYQYRIDKGKAPNFFVGAAAISWVISVRCALNAQRRHKNVKVVKYEDLVNTTKETMDEVMGFIGEPSKGAYPIDQDRWEDAPNSSFTGIPRPELSRLETFCIKIITARERKLLYDATLGNKLEWGVMMALIRALLKLQGFRSRIKRQ